MRLSILNEKEIAKILNFNIPDRHFMDANVHFATKLSNTYNIVSKSMQNLALRLQLYVMYSTKGKRIQQDFIYLFLIVY